MKPLPPPRPGTRVAVSYSHTTKARQKRYRLDYFAADGTRARPVIGTRAEADLAAARLRTQAWEARALGRVQRTMTLAELRDLQLEVGRSKDTIGHDRSRWKLLLEHLGASRSVSSITYSDVVRLRAWLLEQPARRRRDGSAGPATKRPATVNRHLALLRTAMWLAVRDGIITTNPVGSELLLPERERDRVATPEEIARLDEYASPELALAMLLARESGLRLESIVLLVRSRVSLSERTVYIPDTKNGQPVLAPLTSAAVEALSAWMARHDRERLFEASPNAVSKAFALLCRQIGISGLRFHDLKRNAITRLFDAGIDEKVIQLITGMRSSAVRRYRRVDISTMRAAIARVDAR